jgi:hypothetical protein
VDATTLLDYTNSCIDLRYRSGTQTTISKAASSNSTASDTQKIRGRYSESMGVSSCPWTYVRYLQIQITTAPVITLWARGGRGQQLFQTWEFPNAVHASQDVKACTSLESVQAAHVPDRLIDHAGCPLRTGHLPGNALPLVAR